MINSAYVCLKFNGSWSVGVPYLPQSRGGRAGIVVAPFHKSWLLCNRHSPPKCAGVGIYEDIGDQYIAYSATLTPGLSVQLSNYSNDPGTFLIVCT